MGPGPPENLRPHCWHFFTPIRTRSSGPAVRLPFRASVPRFTTFKCGVKIRTGGCSAGSQTLVAAYGGSVWVDPKTARVLRIEMQARNIPSDFPMDQVESAVDYSYVTIGGTSFLLPVHAESLGCERGTSNCSHNIIDFRNYHEYKVDFKIVPLRIEGHSSIGIGGRVVATGGRASGRQKHLMSGNATNVCHEHERRKR